MEAIIARNVRKTYGGLVALRGVDLEVSSGTVTALLGPNGAGKTTLVEILEGHRGRTSGTVTVLGRDPGERRDFAVLRTQLGVVMQQTMLEPGVSAIDLIRRQASYYRRPLGAADLIAAVGLEASARKSVRSLSGGMRRRLDIALALVGRPDVLFLDEPTAGLDPVARRGIHDLVHQMNQDGTTVLLTSHDLDEVQHLADAVAVLDNGSIIAKGTSEDIIAAAAVPTLVQFRLPDARGGFTLPVGAEVEGDMIRYKTADHDAFLRDIRVWEDIHGLTVYDLAVIPPRLDDAYVHLIRNTGAFGDES